MANLLNLTLHKFQYQISRSLRLDSVASERLLRLARVVDHASAIFGNTISAGRWLMISHAALNHATPLSMFDTAYGEQEVEQILCSIEYGLPV
jgi:putative toxin-antitoxin system antitoxin component (TIGR02293 family)